MRSVLIFTSSGIVLFSKHYSQAPVDRMVGALLRTMLELAHGTTGGALRFIELTSMCIYLTRQQDMYCALLYERDALHREPCMEFGRLLSERILAAFIDEFGSIAGGYGHALSTFKGFGLRAAVHVRDVARALVQGLSVVRGLEAAYLLGDDGLTEAYVAPHDASWTVAGGHSGVVRHEGDELLLLSNAKPFLTAMSAVMGVLGEGAAEASVTTDKGVRVLLLRLVEASLVLHVRPDVGETEVRAAAGNTIVVLQRIVCLLQRLRRFGATGGAFGASSLSQGAGFGGGGAGGTGAGVGVGDGGAATTGEADRLMGPAALAAAYGTTDPDFVDTGAAGGHLSGAGFPV